MAVRHQDCGEQSLRSVLIEFFSVQGLFPLIPLTITCEESVRCVRRGRFGVSHDRVLYDDGSRGDHDGR